MSGRSALAKLAIGLAGVFALEGCDAIQSALAPYSPEAAKIALLFWVMSIGGGLIVTLMAILTGIALLGGASARGWLSRDATIIGGGLVFPVVTLTAMLGYGLMLLAEGTATTSEGEPLRITIVGERWWWRVFYHDRAGKGFETANELTLPVERPVELELLTADVIHSLWVPNLAGKLDMIPGRKNILAFTATRTGVSRGQCAEYCGGAHALMAFDVVTMAQAEFVAWHARAASPAGGTRTSQEQSGFDLFMTRGCPACHTIRGTSAAGRIGPDLTHLGSRRSLGAGTLPNNIGTIAAWIVDNQHIKPRNRMPAFQIFDGRELLELASFLASLQ